jgi:hypothetical protein
MATIWTVQRVNRTEGGTGFASIIIEPVLFLLLSSLICACAAVEPGEGTGATMPPPLHYSFSGSGGKTTGPLNITRVELNFQNDRGEITVPLKSRISAYAVIRFDGNGLFRASWEADGRVLEEVAIHVVFGKTLTLTTRPATILPTFEPGPHYVALRIKEPVPGFDIPVIRYFVTGEAARKN